ncbi:hypothetical protein V9T40_008012 [Parthenolecanium corni]|uniref:Uncharacterized protein n=1 Tax=Parthenolecanium corni TaxID=536013 RepID=A0AAN9U1I3_9HEMI
MPKVYRRVLKPPGGGTSDIFGGSEAQPAEKSIARKNSAQTSSIVLDDGVANAKPVENGHSKADAAVPAKPSQPVSNGHAPAAAAAPRARLSHYSSRCPNFRIVVSYFVQLSHISSSCLIFRPVVSYFVQLSHISSSCLNCLSGCLNFRPGDNWTKNETSGRKLRHVDEKSWRLQKLIKYVAQQLIPKYSHLNVFKTGV